MNKTTGLSVVVAVLAATLLLSAFQTSGKEPMRHIVVFKYKPSATPAQIGQVTKAFGELQDKIPGIIAFEHGVNNSPENKNLGFTHVYQLTFEDAAARDAYLPHPEHKKFGALLGRLGVLEDAFVVDYTPVAP
ncbi:stress responsive alpha/beta barrel protein [Pontibacter ummariensis]|uniref:Stress responsive A/B Barrel Domain n=1 Tax=Pontibacter ummariensis TaxID=1610492 RepID=A0A239CPH5_9BACT|nr:Dabb family protein [Pontibacter ummariensis]PRY14915.1 stress responsive alpha/beta barrel protein [Pontibacter ummariensis]SNS21658.1 Stress responsive A/B Barrel Domain [Pontibacter ummariensis]